MNRQLPSPDGLPALQRLALAYASARSRSAIFPVLALDSRLAEVLRARREPLTAQLRLAWWRETLALPAADWPRGEPLLEELRSWRDPAPLARLAEGWEALLVDHLNPQAIAEFVDGRAQAFAALSRELGAYPPERAADAAKIWALADLAANISDGAERELVIEYGGKLGSPPRLSASLRPLAIMAGLGASALADGGRPLLAGPGSLLAALRIGMTGR